MKYSCKLLYPHLDGYDIEMSDDRTIIITPENNLAAIVRPSGFSELQSSSGAMHTSLEIIRQLEEKRLTVSNLRVRIGSIVYQPENS